MKDKTLSYVREKLPERADLYELIDGVLSKYTELQMIIHLQDVVQDESNIPTFVDSIENGLVTHGIDMDEIKDRYRDGLRERLSRLCKIALLT